MDENLEKNEIIIKKNIDVIVKKIKDIVNYSRAKTINEIMEECISEDDRVKENESIKLLSSKQDLLETIFDKYLVEKKLRSGFSNEIINENFSTMQKDIMKILSEVKSVQLRQNVKKDLDKIITILEEKSLIYPIELGERDRGINSYILSEICTHGDYVFFPFEYKGRDGKKYTGENGWRVLSINKEQKQVVLISTMAIPSKKRGYEEKSGLKIVESCISQGLDESSLVENFFEGPSLDEIGDALGLHLGSEDTIAKMWRKGKFDRDMQHLELIEINQPYWTRQDFRVSGYMYSVSADNSLKITDKYKGKNCFRPVIILKKDIRTSIEKNGCWRLIEPN
ncbi:MAG: hypothetical protein Q4G05_03120 [Clostridia bacterium]|nr:hypothetical protein [Clostridia bacterium]